MGAAKVHNCVGGGGGGGGELYLWLRNCVFENKCKGIFQKLGKVHQLSVWGS